MTQLKPFIVGIDPGKSTGVGVLRRASPGKPEKVMSWCTKGGNYEVITYLKTVFADRSEAKVFIELPAAMLYENQKKAKDMKFAKGRDRIMTFVGEVRGQAKILFEDLNREGWDVELVAPVREKKWDAQRFRLFTGSSNPANEHERDAVRLAVYYANKR